MIVGLFRPGQENLGKQDEWHNSLGALNLFDWDRKYSPMVWSIMLLSPCYLHFL